MEIGVSNVGTTASRHTNVWKRALPTDVFKRVDMKGGDTVQCWTFDGFRPPCAPAGMIVVGGRRYYVRRLMYSHWTGIAYDRLPRLTAVCRNNLCCNPTHQQPRKGASRLTGLLAPPTNNLTGE